MLNAWWAESVAHLRGSVRQLLSSRTPVVDKPAPPFVLGLQGGGALGAFTWGVLDRLVETPSFRVSALSGASAGAVNAVLLASGWLNGGTAGAKTTLERFWHRIGHTPSPLRTRPSFWFGGTSVREDFSAMALQMATSVVSPYEFNPLNHNPLRGILGELVDFDRLRAADAPRLFVSATDVENGRARVFDNGNLEIEAVLASACLPHLFQAVEIGGRHYWDGGFTANPALEPLQQFRSEGRLVVVLVNPMARPGVPRAARDIASRLSQIVGNAVVQHEMATLAAAETIELAGDGDDYTAASKYNIDWQFIQQLHDRGRHAADEWLRTSSRA
jgi:NTE family protein